MSFFLHITDTLDSLSPSSMLSSVLFQTHLMSLSHKNTVPFLYLPKFYLFVKSQLRHNFSETASVLPRQGVWHQSIWEYLIISSSLFFLSFSLSFVSGMGVWTQGFLLARQTLYHLSMPPGLRILNYLCIIFHLMLMLSLSIRLQSKLWVGVQKESYILGCWRHFWSFICNHMSRT
jgi:hypothetical protein